MCLSSTPARAPPLVSPLNPGWASSGSPSLGPAGAAASGELEPPQPPAGLLQGRCLPTCHGPWIGKGLGTPPQGRPGTGDRGIGGVLGLAQDTILLVQTPGLHPSIPQQTRPLSILMTFSPSMEIKRGPRAPQNPRPKSVTSQASLLLLARPGSPPTLGPPSLGTDPGRDASCRLLFPHPQSPSSSSSLFPSPSSVTFSPLHLPGLTSELARAGWNLFVPAPSMGPAEALLLNPEFLSWGTGPRGMLVGKAR